MLVLEQPVGAVCGFAVLQTALDEATLLNIVVKPAAQGMGLGSKLLEALVQLASDGCVNRLLLEVRRSNSRAIALYRKYGFLDDGIRKHYYPTATGREDALLMSLELTG